MEKKYMCLCCGYPDLDCRPYENVPDDPHPISLDPPYGDHWGIPSYEVCPCCGFEFGNDDNPGLYAKPISFFEYLLDWVEDCNAEWFDPKRQPQGWNLEKQLRAASPQLAEKFMKIMSERGHRKLLT